MEAERQTLEPPASRAGLAAPSASGPPSGDRAPPVHRLTAAGRFAEGRGLCAGWLHDVRQSPRIAWRLFRRGLVQQYRHSAFGIALAFAPVTLTVLVFVFGRRAQVLSAEVDGVHSAFFGAFGVLLAQAFVETIGSMQRLFAGNGALLKRQNMPIEAPLLAGLIEIGFRDAVRLVVILGLMAAFQVVPSPWMPLLPVALLGVSLAGGAVGLLTAPISGLTADLQVLSRALMMLVAALTPVFAIPSEGSLLSDIQSANPLTWLFNGARAVAYGGSGSPLAAACMPLVSAALFLAGWLFCRIARPHVVERMLGSGG